MAALEASALTGEHNQRAGVQPSRSTPSPLPDPHTTNRTSRISESSSTRASGDGGASSTAREVNREFILSHVERQPGRTPLSREAAEKSLPKLTHLHLNGNRITRVSSSAAKTVPKLEVLYLYDNRIESAENIAQLRCLTHLYLQNNQLYDLSPLGGMQNLQKLYLQGNQIALVAGLEGCTRLEELHVSHQRLSLGASGSGMALDPSCMVALAPRLRVLCATGCGITRELPNLEGLVELRRLTKLDLSHNGLADAVALEELLRPCTPLLWLDVRGNPLAKHNKHRDGLMIALDNLAMLDDEAVQPAQREFLLRLHLKRMRGALAAEQAASAADNVSWSPDGGDTSHAATGIGGVQSIAGATRQEAVAASSRGAGHKPLPQRAGGYGMARCGSGRCQ